MIYLDNAATSWPKPEQVYRAMDSFIRQYGANPGRAGFRMAAQAAGMIEQTRALARELLNAPSGDRVVFTHNCTDALNIAIKGLLKPGDHVITSHLEHNSVSRPLNKLLAAGVEYTRVSHDADGLIDPAAVKELIHPQTRLIVLAHASNVLGTLQPVAEIGRIAREHGVLFLLDAAQTAGEAPIDMIEMNIDLLACPGHKCLFGPPGTGLLVAGAEAEINSLREGGTGSASEEPHHPLHYPDRLEAGTPNTIGLAGLKAGLEYILATGLPEITGKTQQLLGRLLKGLLEISGVEVYGAADPGRRAGLVSFNLAGWDPLDVAAALEAEYEIACRAGLHCAPWTHQALGTYPAGAVRFGVGYFNTAAEIDTAVGAVARLAGQVILPQ